MSLSFAPKKSTCKQRKGIAAVFVITLLLPTIVVLGFTVNLAFMQASRTEQKVAVDCAAKAAVEALARTESVSEARAAAQNVAALHTVGGQQFNLPDSAIAFGNSAENSSGAYVFSEGTEPFNSVRVSCDVEGIPMVFPGMDTNAFSNTEDSTASFMINEVVLCLDRSGSMKFDMSGTDWSYASGNPYVSQPWNFWSHYYSPPHPSLSRWAVLMGAIQEFFDEAADTATPPRVGLVTWSSSSNSAGASTINFPMPAMSITWDSNRQQVESALTNMAAQYNSSGVYGGTEMAIGMDRGIDALVSSNSHSSASRVLVVLTDGQYQGSDPYSVVSRADSEGITIHCVSLLAGTTYAKAKQIAEATGGGAYMATNAGELQEAFGKIARSLTVVLTD